MTDPTTGPTSDPMTDPMAYPFPVAPVPGGHRQRRATSPRERLGQLWHRVPRPSPARDDVPGPSAPPAGPTPPVGPPAAAPAAPASRPEPAGAGPGRGLASEQLVPSLLQRSVRTSDQLALMVAAGFFVWSVGATPAVGPAVIWWWLAGAVAFYLPNVLVARELGRLLPGDGGLYLWAHHALGRGWGLAAGFCAWWPGLLTAVALGPVVLRNLQYVAPDLFAGLGPESQGLVLVALTVLVGAVATAPTRTVQRVVNVGMLLGGLVVLLVVAAAAVRLGRGATPVVDLPGALLEPSGAVHPQQWPLLGLVVFSLLSSEAPLNLAAEVRAGRSPVRYLRFGPPLVLAGYLALLWAVLVTLTPVAAEWPIVALPEVVAQGFGHRVAVVAAGLLAVVALTMTLAAHLVLSRFLFAAGLDRRLPAPLSRLSASGVPVTAIRLQTALVALTLVAVFVLVPASGRGGTPAETEIKAYSVLQAGLLVVLSAAVLLKLVSGVLLVRRARGRLPLGLTVAAVCGGLSVTAAAAGTFFASWTPLLRADDWTVTLAGARFGWGPWSWLVTGTVLASVLVGLALHLVGRLVGRRALARMTTAGTTPPG